MQGVLIGKTSDPVAAALIDRIFENHNPGKIRVIAFFDCYEWLHLLRVRVRLIVGKYLKDRRYGHGSSCFGGDAPLGSRGGACQGDQPVAGVAPEKGNSDEASSR